MPSRARFYKEITEEDCRRFNLNPNINPLTQRRIKSPTTRFNLFLACKQKFGHAIPEEYRQYDYVKARQRHWEEGLVKELKRYSYAVYYGERWNPDGVGFGEKIGYSNALKEQIANMHERRGRPRPQAHQASPPPRQPSPPPRQPPPRNATESQRPKASINMSKDGDSAAKRLQYCKKLSAIALAEKDNTKFVDQGMALARRYGYAVGDGHGRIHLRKAMQLVCHPDKYVNNLSPSNHGNVTEYIQIINNRLDKLK